MINKELWQERMERILIIFLIQVFKVWKDIFRNQCCPIRKPYFHEKYILEIQDLTFNFYGIKVPKYKKFWFWLSPINVVLTRHQSQSESPIRKTFFCPIRKIENSNSFTDLHSLINTSLIHWWLHKHRFNSLYTSKKLFIEMHECFALSS
jgi:hypothetical protein